MGSFLVHVVIENKPTAKDPEGETIMRDLLHRNGFEAVTSVRTAKLLKVGLEAEDEEEARTKVLAMCNNLRIFNPVAHRCTISLEGWEG